MANKMLEVTASRINAAVKKVENIPDEGVQGPKGDTGEQGPKGDTGANGKSIEIQKTTTHIQWRQEGGTWTNLVALSDITGPAGSDIDLTDYALKSWVTEQIGNIQGGGSIDLSSYALKSELHNHANKTELDKIATGDKAKWDAKSDFDGNYNSLTNKPTKLSEFNNDIGIGGTVEIVDDLTSGGANKALSAEQGKVIKSSLDDITTQIDNIGLISKIEVLETEPSGDELYEGRIWISKQEIIEPIEKPCTNITLNNNTLSFTTNSPQTLIATTIPTDTTDTILWSVAPSGNVTVNNGLVTPISNGDCVITATCGTQSITCNVNVDIASEPAEDVIADGLKLYLRGSDFTNSPQTTTLIDASGNNNNATASGFSYSNTSGSDGEGLLITDGVDDKLSITQSETMQFNNEFTFMIVGKITDLTQTKKYVLNLAVTSDAQISIIYGYVTNTFELYNGAMIGDLRTGSQIPIADTSLHSITYTLSNGMLKGYLDGNELINVSKTFNNTQTFNKTNIFSSESAEYIKIGMKSILLYNRGLTASEVLENHNKLI